MGTNWEKFKEHKVRNIVFILLCLLVILFSILDRHKIDSDHAIEICKRDSIHKSERTQDSISNAIKTNTLLSHIDF